MQIHVPLAILLAASLAGCSGDDSSETPADDTQTQAPGAAETPTEAPATATAPAAVTWNEHVKPIVYRSCLRCHTSDGVGPGDFTRYEDAAPMAPLMAAFTGAGLMPPAASDPGCRDYEYSERMFLSDEERQVFADWADAGAPEGDPAMTPEIPDYNDRLLDANLTLIPPQKHRPDFDEAGNEYYCVILDPDTDDTFYINAFDVRVDRTDIVHHLVLYLDIDGDAGPEGAKNGDGYDCFHESGNVMMLHAWAPGGGPVVFEEGMGMKVEPHQRFVLQMHYYKSFEGAEMVEDASGYAMRTLPSVDKDIYMLPFGPTGFTIPAGVQAHTETDTYLMDGDLPNMKIWGAFPHMHLLGSSYRYWIQPRAGGEECLLDSPQWDFHNQLTYEYKTPVSFRQGDEIFFSCTWDNSASNPNQLVSPPQEVVYGDGTNDEMCFVFSYVSLGL